MPFPTHFSATGSNNAHENPPVRLQPGWLNPSQADTLLQHLLHWDGWRQEQVCIFGRRLAQPRLSAFVGEPGLVYRYSGLRLQAMAWPVWLEPLRRSLRQHNGRPFNSCLLNFYRDGRDHLSWHADDEPELGTDPELAIYSLGASRALQFRPRGQSRLSHRFQLTHNSLLHMLPGCQAHWQHRIAISRRTCTPRISLTFRHIESQSPSRP